MELFFNYNTSSLGFLYRLFCFGLKTGHCLLEDLFHTVHGLAAVFCAAWI